MHEMSLLRVVRQSVRYHRRMGIAVALGVAAATAVITGALLVGDSMRGSLRALTLQRLGKIESAVIPGHFFAAERVEAAELDRAVVPLIFFGRAAIETADRDAPTRRAGSVQVIASDERFWHLDAHGVRPDVLPEDDQVVLNAALAAELEVTIGDSVTVRIPRAQAVPADSPLGSDESETEGLPRLTVVDIVPNEGLARFSLAPSQQQPFTAWLPLDVVQDALDRPGQANMLLATAGREPPGGGAGAAGAEAWVREIPWQLEDYGLQLKEADIGYVDDSDQRQSTLRYWSLTSDRMLLDEGTVDAVTKEFGPQSVQPVLTYLANAIQRLDGAGQPQQTVAYSTISAIDPGPTFPLDDYIEQTDLSSAAAWKDGRTVAARNGERPAEPPSGPMPVVINSWTAQQLKASVGDPLRVYYYEPESVAGREVERSFEARVVGVVPITTPSMEYRRRREASFDAPPTPFNDPNLTPQVPGVTDQDSISDWELPFQLEREITRDDDYYWNNFRLTPKLFLPLDQGRELFGSRFGDVSGLRLPIDIGDEAAVRRRIENAQQGFDTIPLREQQLAASQGTTPFDALFLSLSLFVILAALLLVALLFRLGLEQRAAEFGAMLALGLPQQSVRAIAVVEGSFWSLIGAVIGAAAGIGYAMLILEALSSRWVGAVTVPFLEFYWTPLSLFIGLVAGHFMAAVTLWWTARQLGKVNLRGLLFGRVESSKAGRGKRRRWVAVAGWVCLAAGVLTCGYAFLLVGPAQAGAFVGGGMLLLSGVLLALYARLDRPVKYRAAPAIGGFAALVAMASRSARRNPLRSTMTIGMLAVACFLIVSMSAFQLRPTEQGVGGFDLIAESATPLFRDLADPEVQRDLIGRDTAVLEGAEIYPCRLRPGQDASCNNLYRAAQPRVLGVTDRFVESIGDRDPERRFQWSSAAEDVDNPWRLLQAPAAGTLKDPVPVVLDQNTAMWALQMRGGVGEVRGFQFDPESPTYFRVVGLLSGSVLQGSLLVGERNFTRLFPELSGYSYYLIRSGGNPQRLSEVLESRLGDVGMDVVSSYDLLAQLLAVQNTYLQTFQALGALGLLLGTFGLAVVQVRSVLERRREMALLRAVGFTRSHLGELVLLENSSLLISGLLLGTAVALIAVLPYSLTSGTPLGVGQPLLMLAIVLVVGTLAGTAAIFKVSRLPLLESLRGT